MTLSPWHPRTDDSPARRVHLALVSATATSNRALAHCETIPEPDWEGPASGGWQRELDHLRTALQKLDSALDSARIYAHRVWISEMQS